MKKILFSLALILPLPLALGQVDTATIDLGEAVITSKYYKKYIEEEVSGTLRLEGELLDMPQNISIITNRAIEDQQIISMSDAVVRNVSGAIKLEHWGDLYTRINMRGSRAAAFLNGVNVTSNWGPLSEDMSYVDHIEFVKGPAGFLMSNGEPSGIYNIVTKKATGKSLNGSVRFTLGSFDLYRAEADIDTKITDRLAVRFNLMGQNKGSFRDYEFNDRYITSTSLRYKFSDKTILNAEYRYQKAKMSEVGSAYVFSNDGYATFPVEYTISDPNLPDSNVDEHTVEVNLQHKFNENWKLTTQFTYMNDYTIGGDIWPSSLTSDGLMIRDFFYWEAINDQKFGQVFLNGNVKIGAVGHKILAGIDMGDKSYIADWSQGFRLDVTNPFDIYNPQPYSAYEFQRIYVPFDKSIPLRSRANKIDQTYTGIYVQDELSFFDESLRLTLAARYTNAKNSNYGTESEADKLTPRIGVSYSIDNQTSIYGLFDQAFVPQSGVIKSGEKVKPITGNNMELGVKRDWANGKWLTTLSVYRIVKNNELTSDPANNPGDQYSLVLGKKRSAGLEFDVKGEITRGLNLIFNYAFTEYIITESNVVGITEGTREPGYAKHALNGWLNYTIQQGTLKGLGFNFGGMYLADRSTWSWESESAPISLGDYVKFDTGVFWNYKDFKINLNVFNVFDRYLYSGSPYGTFYYYQAEAPRNWRLSVGYQF